MIQPQTLKNPIVKKPKKYSVGVDTNVFQVNLTTLLLPETQKTSIQAIYCKSCRAAINLYSKITVSKLGKTKWVCEFCGVANTIASKLEKITSNDVLNQIILKESK